MICTLPSLPCVSVNLLQVLHDCFNHPTGCICLVKVHLASSDSLRMQLVLAGAILIFAYNVYMQGTLLTAVLHCTSSPCQELQLASLKIVSALAVIPMTWPAFAAVSLFAPASLLHKCKKPRCMNGCQEDCLCLVVYCHYLPVSGLSGLRAGYLPC